MGPTTKDLARAAGVSLATVDRVLNDRGGVSLKKAQAVAAAIEQIGFERNAAAAALARQRSLRLGFVIPKTGGAFLDKVLLSIQEYETLGRSEMTILSVIRIEDKDAHKAARSIANIDANDFDAIAVMATQSPPLRDALLRLAARGVHITSFLTKQELEGDVDFVGIDNRAAGATAGRLMGQFLGRQKGAVLPIAESLQSRDTLERRLGFDDVIGNKYPHIRPLPTLETYADPDRARKVISTAWKARPDTSGIYLLTGEAAGPVSALRELNALHGNILIAHERTSVTEDALRAGELDAVISQDPGHLVRSAVRIMRARCEKRRTLASQERIRIEILVAENL
jgi:LacI family transcriptional regulator